MECIKDRKYHHTVPVHMTANIYVFLDPLVFYFFCISHVEWQSFSHNNSFYEQLQSQLYCQCSWHCVDFKAKSAEGCHFENKNRAEWHKRRRQERRDDICACALLWGLRCWWPSDRVSAIQISGITSRTLSHRQPDRAQLIASQWTERFTCICSPFHPPCQCRCKCCECEVVGLVVLFLGFSSAFNTVVPCKLNPLGLSRSLRTWIMDCLTGWPPAWGGRPPA